MDRSGRQCGPRRAGARAAAALIALAAALLPLVVSPPAQADPSLPSPADIARSQTLVTSRAADVARIQGQLAAADVRMQHVAVEVAQAVEAYDGAVYRLQVATDAAFAARGNAEAAAGAADAAHAELGRFAAATYRSGGSLSGLSVVLGAQSVDDLARRGAVLQLLGGQRDASLRRMRSASAVSTVLQTSADTALTRQAAAAQAVEAAKQAAQARLAGEQQAVAAIQAQRAALVSSLASARRTSVALEQARLDGLARIAAERAEAARRNIAAARLAQRPDLSGPVPAGGTSHGTTAGAAAAIAFARSQLGKPYQWGATGPDTYDCSGLTMRAWQRGGVSLPHFSVAQYEVSHPVALGSLRPGDLVFFGSDPSDYHSIYHVGLYVGGGQMLEAPFTGESVRYSTIWRSSLFGAARP